MANERDLDVDPATHARLLRFLNDAESATDLVRPPEGIRTRHQEHHDELRHHGKEAVEQEFERRKFEQPQIGEPRFKVPDAPLFDEEVAERILEERERMSPLYGFIHLNDLLDRIDIDLDPILVPFGPARFGSWSKKASTPFGVAHAALVHTPGDHHHGRVLFIESAHGTDTARTPLWRPKKDEFESISAPGENVYCSGHSFLPDGKLLVAGGGGRSSRMAIQEAYLFDPDGKTWMSAGDTLNHARWYPTLVTLGDDSGRVLVVNGYASEMEIYQYDQAGETGTFVTVDDPVGGPVDASHYSSGGDYPNLLPLPPNGDIVFTRCYRHGSASTGSVFSFTDGDRGEWSDLTGSAKPDDREGGMSALLLGQRPSDQDRLIVVGGGDTASTRKSVALIDVPPSGSVWRTDRFPDGHEREHPNVVLLPDGSVFIAGGTDDPSHPCWIYQPWSRTPWWEMASMSYKRNDHHSVAMLLPSGKVMITGHGSRTIEVFSPPYLFDNIGRSAEQPEITSAPEPYDNESVLHGGTFEVGTPDAPDIERVVMVRPMAVTHKTDTEQRVIPCDFIQSASNRLQVTAPDTRVYPYGLSRSHSHVTAPRGFYMLFLIDHMGTPSPARFVHLR